MRTTVRTSETDPQHNFSEQTTGDAPSSVSINQNAKGKWQPDIKLQFATPEEALSKAPDLLQKIVAALAERFPLAGE